MSGRIVGKLGQWSYNDWADLADCSVWVYLPFSIIRTNSNWSS